MKHLAALLPLLAACGGEPDEIELTLDEPSSTVELLPGGEVPMAWTITGGDAELVITLTVLNGDEPITIYDENEVEGTGGFTWDGTDVDGVVVHPQVYDLEATLFVDGEPGDSHVRNVSIHGVYFTDPDPDEELTITGTTAPIDVHYVTVSQRVIHLRTRLEPGAIYIDDRTIPGEFTPFERDIHFTGLDAEGAAIPDGDYTVHVDVTDDDEPSFGYTSDGGIVHWRPSR